MKQLSCLSTIARELFFIDNSHERAIIKPHAQALFAELLWSQLMHVPRGKMRGRFVVPVHARLALMRLTRWNKKTLPSLEALRSALMGEGFSVSEWVDAPGTVYPVQSHEIVQVRWILRGELRIGLPETGEEFVLGAGDRLDLPPNTPYWMDVNGAAPAMYLSATKTNPNNHKK